MRMQLLMFAKDSLDEYLDARMRELRQEVHDWDPDQLLKLAEQDVVDYLVKKYEANCPVLHRDQTVQEPVTRVKVEAEATVWQGLSRSQVEVIQITLVVPYEGDQNVFKLRASTFSYSPPTADVGSSELRMVWRGQPSEASAIQQYFDQQLAKIEQGLGWSRAQIETFNKNLLDQARSAVAGRRAQLLADRNLQASLAYPVRHGDGAAATYAIPVTRKKVVIQRPKAAPGPFTPEPTLSDEAYEAALAVLRNARNALERSPSTTATRSEEQLRDLLLVFLNLEFEGQAAGEVFNGHGKTDILIRDGDRNVFIAECKIWKSPVTIREGLDQLLSYLVWRDIKAALLLFIRGGNATSKISKALAEIEQHPNRKRTVPNSQADERHDFVFRANDDQEREIRLAFMPFALG